MIVRFNNQKCVPCGRSHKFGWGDEITSGIDRWCPSPRRSMAQPGGLEVLASFQLHELRPRIRANRLGQRCRWAKNQRIGDASDCSKILCRNRNPDSIDSLVTTHAGIVPAECVDAEQRHDCENPRDPPNPVLAQFFVHHQLALNSRAIRTCQSFDWMIFRVSDSRRASSLS